MVDINDLFDEEVSITRIIWLLDEAIVDRANFFPFLMMTKRYVGHGMQRDSAPHDYAAGFASRFLCR